MCSAGTHRCIGKRQPRCGMCWCLLSVAPIWQAAPDLLQVLRERGIGVLPDVYANGGGVIVSFFEWVQNQQTYR